MLMSQIQFHLPLLLFRSSSNSQRWRVWQLAVAGKIHAWWLTAAENTGGLRPKTHGGHGGLRLKTHAWWWTAAENTWWTAAENNAYKALKGPYKAVKGPYMALEGPYKALEGPYKPYKALEGPYTWKNTKKHFPQRNIF